MKKLLMLAMVLVMFAIVGCGGGSVHMSIVLIQR